VASRRKKAQQIRPDRSCGQWTDADYALAKELMQKIRLLPEDWADDIVQEIEEQSFGYAGKRAGYPEQ